MSKKRTNLESYVDFGFDIIVTDDVQKPVYLLLQSAW